MSIGLVRFTCICLILASIGVAGEEVREFITSLATIPNGGTVQLKVASQATAAEASYSITNTSSTTVYNCTWPTVRRKADGKKIHAVPVCTGDLKPHTTIRLTAPFDPGAVEELCGHDTEYGRRVDWSLCEFTDEAIPD